MKYIIKHVLELYGGINEQMFFVFRIDKLIISMAQLRNQQ